MRFELIVDCPEKLKTKVFSLCYMFLHAVKTALELINSDINVSLIADRKLSK